MAKAIYNEVKWVGLRPTQQSAEDGANKVSVGSSSTTILAANDDRASFIIMNYGTQDVFLNFGSAATTNDFPLKPNATLSDDDYTGAVYGIVAAGTCDVRVIEV